MVKDNFRENAVGMIRRSQIRMSHNCLSFENRSFNPPAPHSWGDIKGRWGDTPQSPRQRGIAPYGILIFILHGVGGNPSMADSLENVILNPPQADEESLPTGVIKASPENGYFNPLTPNVYSLSPRERVRVRGIVAASLALALRKLSLWK